MCFSIFSSFPFYFINLWEGGMLALVPLYLPDFRQGEFIFKGSLKCGRFLSGKGWTSGSGSTQRGFTDSRTSKSVHFWFFPQPPSGSLFCLVHSLLGHQEVHLASHLPGLVGPTLGQAGTRRTGCQTAVLSKLLFRYQQKGLSHLLALLLIL